MAFLVHDFYIGQALERYGEYSESEGAIFAQILRPGDVAIEVGANIGAHTLHLARLVGGKGRVLAFEPQRIVFQILCTNIVLNELFNVHAYQEAVSQTPGSIKVPVPDYTRTNNFGGTELGKAKTGETVPVVTLDQKFDLPSLRLLKIDVEGMEADVIAGARGLIMRHRPILYLENDRKDKSEALIRLVQSLNYKLWWHRAPHFNPNNFRKCQEDLFPGVVSFNMLGLPAEQNMTAGTGLTPVTDPTLWCLNDPVAG